LLPAFLDVEGDGSGASFHRAAALLVGLAIAGVMVLLKLGIAAMSHVFEHRRLGAERPST
jgi:hypothetical protein